jgi:hypothetical protein
MCRCDKVDKVQWHSILSTLLSSSTIKNCVFTYFLFLLQYNHTGYYLQASKTYSALHNYEAKAIDELSIKKTDQLQIQDDKTVCRKH